MRIWAHILVKNEARWLWYAVSSVVNCVDKILLWDSGSTDGTLDVIAKLQKKYPGKIEFKERKIASAGEFAVVRQEMLDASECDWFIVVDGDEIWWKDSIKKVVDFIKDNGDEFESVVVPTINLVGDIYHYQPKSAGNYKFGHLTGHYNLRAVRKNIPGLHSQGVHGVWGWADDEGKQIQDRKTFGFIEAPYLHATNLPRSKFDQDVIKRGKKLKYEIGISFPKDFYYPEVLFEKSPSFVESPWTPMTLKVKIRAYLETPLKLLKRKLWKISIGY